MNKFRFASLCLLPILCVGCGQPAGNSTQTSTDAPAAASAASAAAVDFKKQFVLVFAWQGSGGDTLSYHVLESYPEQIAFMRKPGMTKDLRSHAKVYALRSNVKWRVKDKK